MKNLPWLVLLGSLQTLLLVAACGSQKRVLETQVSSLARERTILMDQLESERELRRTLEATLEDARRTLNESEERFSICKDELTRIDVQDKRELMAKLEECGKREPLVRTAAYEQGMREVWESVQFTGKSWTEKKDFWFDDHYFTFEVVVKDKRHSWTVRTETSESGFGKLLSEIFDLAATFSISRGGRG